MKEISKKYLDYGVLNWIKNHKEVYTKFGYPEPTWKEENGKYYIEENDLFYLHTAKKYVKENIIHPHTYNGIPFNPMRNVRTTHYGYGRQDER